ncbi:aminotransferase class IV [Candidatus Haliotispira prima]|uniref:Branched-chain-amino-acid aminotransferase n=1 Tax=Candidatus Haliotispira prima TaxID=3034016 RepID=A0ABY8MJX1_9SPIO|nr:aminotransferase class IV [Candidatus Haliotispira prima]
MAFAPNIHSWVYLAEFQNGGTWKGSFQNKNPYTLADFAKLSQEEQRAVYTARNQFSELCLVSYTSQYALGVFEGLKAFPQADGSWTMFRPLDNCKRMQRSMAGILQPTMEPEALLEALLELMRHTIEQGVDIKYQSSWERDHFNNACAIYIRPFSYSEPGLGVNRSQTPWIIAVSTPVSGYFDSGKSTAMISDRVRAMPGGTGWIKCASNYVISMLARCEAREKGFMEAIFLDGKEQRYLEEGSGSNIFVLLKNGTLVTPELKDTILPGITRDSVIKLAKAEGTCVEERPVSISELLSDGAELFATGTAAGLVPIHGIDYKGSYYDISSQDEESLTVRLQTRLKGIQYGLLPDPYDWVVKI